MISLTVCVAQGFVAIISPLQMSLFQPWNLLVLCAPSGQTHITGEEYIPAMLAGPQRDKPTPSMRDG